MKLLDSGMVWHLFWILPAAVLLWIAGSARAKRFLNRLFPDGSHKKYADLSTGRRVVRCLILFAALACLFLAAARPAWGERILPEQPPGRDLMAVLDISRSMLSDNVRPTRLDHAKMILRDLVSSPVSSGDRFGLTAFAGNAELVCPLTSDDEAFLRKLDALEPVSAKRGGTNLQTALETALLALEGGSAGNSRAVILISDGGELEGDSAKTFAAFRKNRIPVFVLGIGEPSAPALIPLKNRNGGVSMLKDADGNTVNAALNETALRTIAEQTGGVYIRSTTLRTGLDTLESRIRKMTAERRTVLDIPKEIERPGAPLAAALILLCVYLLVSERKTTKRTALSILLCLMVPCLSAGEPSEKVTDQMTDQMTASETTSEPAEMTPESIYHDALRLQNDGKDDDAAARYTQAITAAGNAPDVRANAYLNLGVIGHRAARKDAAKAEQDLSAGKLDDSLKDLDAGLEKLRAAEEHYRESLRSDPGADLASAVRNQTILIRERKNMEERKKEIEELKKRQQQAQQQAQQALDQQ